MRRWFLNFSFNGRALRSHCWANYVTWLIVLALLASVGTALEPVAGSPAAVVFGLLLLASLPCFLIDHLAVVVRRAHDTGKSGWISLLLLIPLVNLLPLYWLLIQEGQEGPNKYGAPVEVS